MTHHDLVESGRGLEERGKIVEAAEVYRQVLLADPAHREALERMGLLALRAGSPEAAADLFSRAVRQDRRNAELYLHLAETWMALDRLGEARRCCHRAMELAPGSVGARVKLGAVFLKQEELLAAETVLRQAIAMDESNVDALTHLAYALIDLHKADEAVEVCRAVVKLRAGNAVAHKNLGSALDHANRAGEAVEEFERALAIDRDYFEAYMGMARALRRAGRPMEAVASFERAAELRPELSEPKYLMAHPLLLAGDFARGWEMYEWRWKCRPFSDNAAARTQPAWDGSDPHGKTLLLLAEQGFGDAIQFIRYAPILAERGARLVLACAPALQSLFRALPGVELTVSRDLPLPVSDYRVPLMSLPRILGTTIETIPARIPYLRADEAKVETWKKKMGPGRNIGLAWAGNVRHEEDRFRSCPVEALRPLVEMPGATWHSLQKGVRSTGTGDVVAEATTPLGELSIVDHSSELRDFSETAALIENLDLVICVDTAVAHLAGAMGKAVWLMLHDSPDWRWMLEREDSPWYPTMRIFRQENAGDWDGVVARVVRECSK